jgi:hypothetical protein
MGGEREDQKTLLRIHQMVVLSTLRYGETIYGSVSKAFGKQEIDVRKVETYTRPPWLVYENETIDLIMCAIPKGASRERIQAEFPSLMVDK